MTAFWELEVVLPADVADEAGAALIAAGAAGVEIVTDGMPRLADAPGRTPPGAGRALVVATWNGEQSPDTLRADGEAALAELGISAELHAARRDDTDWAERWKSFYQPMQLGRLWVVPAWLKPPRGAERVILVEPGMAFGTGQHASTALCIEMIGERVSGATETFLDVGCGSGILAVAAALLGARHVVGIDNDPDVMRVCEENARLNRVHFEASTTPVEEVPGSFQVVVANILANVLIPMAPVLLERVVEAGELMLSGILAVEADEVVAAYESTARAAGRALRIAERPRRGDWEAIRFFV
jgi:ribosomal protein L11 methyltransferase